MCHPSGLKMGAVGHMEPLWFPSVADEIAVKPPNPVALAGETKDERVEISLTAKHRLSNNHHNHGNGSETTTKKKNLWEKTGEKSLRGRSKVTKKNGAGRWLAPKTHLRSRWSMWKSKGTVRACRLQYRKHEPRLCVFFFKKWFFFSPRPKRVNHFSVLILIKLITLCEPSARALRGVVWR